MKLIIGSVLVVVISQVMGQFIPPFSILFGTTFLIPIVVCIINFSDKRILRIEFTKDLSVTARIILVYFCASISFVLDFLYASGTKDAEGDAIVLLSSFVAVMVSGIIMMSCELKNRENRKTKINLGHVTLILAIPFCWLLLNRFGTENILYKVLG
jgi:uncharacterized membrane protein